MAVEHLPRYRSHKIVRAAPCAGEHATDFEAGRMIAYNDARSQIWALQGYLLRSRLANAAAA